MHVLVILLTYATKKWQYESCANMYLSAKYTVRMNAESSVEMIHSQLMELNFISTKSANCEWAFLRLYSKINIEMIETVLFCDFNHTFILSYYLINEAAYFLLKALFESLICLMKWFHMWNVEALWITFRRTFGAIFCELKWTNCFHCLTVNFFLNKCKLLAALSLPTFLKFDSQWILKYIHIVFLSRFLSSDNKRNLDRNDIFAMSSIFKIFRHLFGINGKRQSWHGFTGWIRIFELISIFILKKMIAYKRYQIFAGSFFRIIFLKIHWIFLCEFSIFNRIGIFQIPIQWNIFE